MPETLAQDEGFAPTADDLEIVIAGATYTGWESVSISRSIDQAAGSFKVRAAPSVSGAWPIRPLQAVEVRIGGKAVVTGFVDSLKATSGPDGRSVEVSGRDKAADLVDSSATIEPGEFRGLGLFGLAHEFASPLGIEIRPGPVFASTNEPFPVFAVNPGETAWTAIERATRLRGVLAFSDGLGNLAIERPEARVGGGSLIEGGESGNVIESTLTWNLTERFQIYTVKGQSQGSDFMFGASVAEVVGVAQDLEIDRGRSLLIIAEGQVSIQQAEERAQWEASIRRSRSLVLQVKVAGWRPFTFADAWEINAVVLVKISSLSIAANFLVRGVKFSRSVDSGAETLLSLIPQGTLEPQPVIPKNDGPFDDILDADEYDEEF